MENCFEPPKTKKKMIFFATPSPSGGGDVVAALSPA